MSNLSRCEASIEHSIFKSIHERQRLQAARRGKDVPLPFAVDVDLSGNEERKVGSLGPNGHKIDAGRLRIGARSFFTKRTQFSTTYFLSVGWNEATRAE